MASAGEDGFIRVWDFRKRSLKAEIKASRNVLGTWLKRGICCPAYRVGRRCRRICSSAHHPTASLRN